MLDALSRAKGASYPPLHELCPAVSRQLSDVIDKALAFDYHDRYRRMLDFLDTDQKVRCPRLDHKSHACRWSQNRLR